MKLDSTPSSYIEKKNKQGGGIGIAYVIAAATILKRVVRESGF